MKKLFICLSVAAALASCSNSDNNSVINPDADNLIRLTAGVPSASVTSGTKAPITTNATFEAGVAGWESAEAPSYSTAAKWTASASVKASSASQTITLNPQQVYDDETGKTTYIKAYYPAGTLNAGMVNFENLTGEIDAMLAPVVSGSKDAKITAPLAFAHRTTQLVFKVAGESGFTAGTKLEYIKVKNAELPTGFDLTTDAVTFGTPADLEVPGIKLPLIPVNENQMATPIKVGNAVMIKPISGNKVLLDIKTAESVDAKVYENVEATIDNDNDFAEGRAYTITLTFRKVGGVNLNATMAEWTTGTGAGNVD